MSKTWFRVVVEPKNKGDLGWIRVGGVYYTENELEELSEKISRDILRHVDDVGNVYVEWDKAD